MLTAVNFLRIINWYFITHKARSHYLKQAHKLTCANRDMAKHINFDNL